MHWSAAQKKLGKAWASLIMHSKYTVRWKILKICPQFELQEPFKTSTFSVIFLGKDVLGDFVFFHHINCKSFLKTETIWWSFKSCQIKSRQVIALRVKKSGLESINSNAILHWFLRNGNMINSLFFCWHAKWCHWSKMNKKGLKIC